MTRIMTAGPIRLNIHPPKHTLTRRSRLEIKKTSYGNGKTPANPYCFRLPEESHETVSGQV
jgi:hypothetical protein